jgi:argininosuccinate lyase
MGDRPMKKLWGGRFKKSMNSALKDFSYSLACDGELLGAEVKVNRAYAKMLTRIGLMSRAEMGRVLKGLELIEKKWTPKKLEALSGQYEDVHSFVQSELEKMAGSAARKIHTGRSRNDLVVTSTRIWLREKAAGAIVQIGEVQKALVFLATKADKIIFPGMTHLRKAQPVLMAHHLLAYVEMLQEDVSRLQDAMKRINVLGLGSAALAGSALPLDQKFLAKELGFQTITSNSMAATSDRSFLVEVVADLSILWMHLSRMAEDFILWNSEPFNLIELDDAFATGSSLMPQKKNPDIFELIRGRSGVVFGHLTALLTIQKGLPLCYNRDLQEDKPGVFDVFRKTRLALELLPQVLRTIAFKPESASAMLLDETLFATDMLEYLVRKKIAFSQAHEIVGKIVAYAQEKKKNLRTLELAEYRRFSGCFDESVYDLFNAEVSVRAKKTAGSTHPHAVWTEIGKWEKRLGR